MERMLATPADAEIILKLYELRTEAVMRQARGGSTEIRMDRVQQSLEMTAGDALDLHAVPGR